MVTFKIHHIKNIEKASLHSRVLRYGIPAQHVGFLDQGRVEVTLRVAYPLMELGDIDNLKDIKKKVRGSGGKIEPRATPKPICMNATYDWFLPQFESSDSE